MKKRKEKEKNISSYFLVGFLLGPYVQVYCAKGIIPMYLRRLTA